MIATTDYKRNNVQHSLNEMLKHLNPTSRILLSRAEQSQADITVSLVKNFQTYQTAIPEEGIPAKWIPNSGFAQTTATSTVISKSHILFDISRTSKKPSEAQEDLKLINKLKKGE
jgi:hypothetical protein